MASFAELGEYAFPFIIQLYLYFLYLLSFTEAGGGGVFLV